MFLNKLKNYTLELIVFLSGGCLMILEVVGSRILAPYVGTSTVIWAILIGVILGFLSLGYYIGGKYADRKANLEILSDILLLSSFSVFLIVIINRPILDFIVKNARFYSIGSILLGVTSLFSLPSLLLGMVSPYAAKLKLKTLSTSGDTIGKLYAISTIGSIAGTFLAGFFLIPFLGTIKILFLITIVLILISIVAKRPKLFSKKTFFIFLLFVLLLQYLINYKQNYITDTDTFYNRVLIKGVFDKVIKRPIIYLITDPFSNQAAIFADRDDDLVLQYLKYYRLGDFFNPHIKQALIIGGGGYSYPKDFLLKHPEARIDVVEIDPGITQLAKKYFNLKDDSRMTIFHEDGRVFLNLNKNKYDVIYMDAFKSISVPYQLTTKEVIQKMSDSLNEKGLVLLNIVSSFEGNNSRFFQSELATYRTVFPLVYAFQVKEQKGSQNIQNIILVALKEKRNIHLSSTNPELNNYLKMVWQKKSPSNISILTDDYAPVDYYAFNLF